ncbi:MAG: 16S rRNA (adenine(1518)-N(6)/adenine(1519)-N(6))-dimethyltransferase RsmA [Bacteroidota bacterium]
MDKLKPKKYWGQHFLRDGRTAEKIVQSLTAPAGAQVVEIGPGQGVLTELLLPAYPDLMVVEVDPEAVAYLKANLSAEKLQIVHQDVLQWKPAQHLKAPAYFIGNLPYNISSPFFFLLLENLEWVKEGVFMIQKEVAKRICADPHSKVYGILSVLIGAYFERQYAFTVPPGVFRPPPKVDSGVIRLVPKTSLPDLPFDTLKRVVKTAFGQRRKTLRNALKSLEFEDFPEKEAWFQKRAENLEIQEFIHLASHLKS